MLLHKLHDELLMTGLANWASDNGNKIAVEQNAVW